MAEERRKVESVSCGEDVLATGWGGIDLDVVG